MVRGARRGDSAWEEDGAIGVAQVNPGLQGLGAAVGFPAMTIRFRRRHRFGHAGFTLVELMVVILIISVLAMLAVPGISRIRLRAKTAVVVSDFRTFAGAFESYAQETGGWPRSARPESCPPE